MTRKKRNRKIKENSDKREEGKIGWYLQEEREGGRRKRTGEREKKWDEKEKLEDERTGKRKRREKTDDNKGGQQKIREKKEKRGKRGKGKSLV